MSDMDISALLATAKARIRLRPSEPATLEDRNIRLLYHDIAWQGIAAAGIGTFISIFLARLGASGLLISWLTALPALVTILVSLPASMYVERQRNQVRTTTIFRLLFRSTYLIAAFLPFFFRSNLPLMIVLLWGLQAIPMAFATVAWTSVMGVVVPPARRPMVNGGRWALHATVTAVFTAAFGKLLDLPWLSFPLNYQIVFFLSAVSSLFSAIYFDQIIPPVSYVTEQPARLTLRERFSQLLSPMIHNRPFMNYLLSTFLVRFGMGMPTALYSIFWVRNLSASDTIIGLRTTVSQVALVVAYYILGRLAVRRGHRGLLLWSSVGLGLYPIVTALSPNQFWLLPAAVLVGVASAGINIAFFEGLLETTPIERVPSFAALNTIFANVAVFVGPLLGAFLMEWLGIVPAFFIAGAMHFAGTALCWYTGVGSKTPC